MKWKYAFFLLLISFFVINCSQTKDIPQLSSKILSPNDISVFHSEMVIKIGWVPYEGQKLVKTKRNEWKVVQQQESGKVSALPTIIIEYPEDEETIMLDMSIDNKLLGKLIKHSAMTMVPISRPFTQFFEDAKCESCHPEDVKVDLGYIDYLEDENIVTKLTDSRNYVGTYSE